jgi:hypothetical protein
MAKNLSREFATMSEEERRKFALEEEEGTRELPAELEFEEPRNPDTTGAQFASIKEETADPDNRDGMSALLDDEQHRRAVEKAARRNGRPSTAAD